MFYADLFRRVRNIAGDTSVLQVTQAMLYDWVNDCVREIVVSESLLQKTATSVLVINQQEYTLPTDILKLYSVMVNEEKIRVYTHQEWEELSAGYNDGLSMTIKGMPNQCFVWAGKLNLYPPPDTAWNLKVNYIRQPVDAVIGDTDEDADSPDLPDMYHLRIVTYCLAQVALLDEDTYRYNGLMADFRNGVLDLTHNQKQEEDLYPFMSVASRDMGHDVEWWQW
jgi:uncharacterized protein YaiE (UPF0345 family)